MPTNIHDIRRTGEATSALAAVALLLAATAAAPVHAQAWVPASHHGSITVTYNQAKSTRLTNSDASKVPFGELIARGLHLGIDYGLTDRLAISAALPFTSNRYRGDDPHDPRTLPFPNDQSFIDDGRFHGAWSDWNLSLRYQWLTKPFLVTPFIGYGQPTHDYTFWAHAAPGSDQWSWQAGVHVGDWLAPPWQNFFWQAGYTYSFMQPLDHRRVNHGAVSLSAGYTGPRFDVRVELDHRNSYGDTINLPRDFFNPDGSLNFGNLYYHDQLAAARYTKATIVFDYRISQNYQVSFSLGRNLSAANAHLWDYETRLGISRRF